MIAWHTCYDTDMREEGRRRRENLVYFNKIQIWEGLFVFDGAVCVLMCTSM